ncbi:MAG: hypothetical protein E7601_00085 [Ruminococcaceae bacterium]|nr:hypothetical protein [Oscillospiraceae bacterium]
MKKTWFYPILGSLLLCGWFVASHFIQFPGNGYAGLEYMLLGGHLILLVFPVCFAWYASKHVKFVILPSLYVSVIFALPWIYFLIQDIKNGISYIKKSIFYVLIMFLIWNVICFSLMRLYRFLKQRYNQKENG